METESTTNTSTEDGCFIPIFTKFAYSVKKVPQKSTAYKLPT